MAHSNDNQTVKNVKAKRAQRINEILKLHESRNIVSSVGAADLIYAINAYQYAFVVTAM